MSRNRWIVNADVNSNASVNVSWTGATIGGA